MTAGRFAPSPTGELHVGNLRTAILAWLFAHSTGRQFLLRVEDLDRVRAGAEETQLAELAAVGLSWDGEVTRQSQRRLHYDDAVSRLRRDGLLFECFCTRRDVAEAASAPHVLPGHYPGTCRDVPEAERMAARRVRPAALRLRTDVGQFEVHDVLHGRYTGAVDDFVVVRNDGVPAYNLAVVVDDAEQAIDQVVRGDDLLTSAPRQAYLGSLLGLPPVEYAHVPLALNPERRRLAKRDGAVTLEALAAEGWEASAVSAVILRSLGLPDSSLEAALSVFDPSRLPREPWIVDPSHLSSTDAAPVRPNR
ncbi:tRNA glutamyl-Q(34) synthetase GluQRS [Arthrobacter tumbae]|uniref:tRNA glutamyl-Q(34) synthetase GluQRS n=1 Tax=Arthrobacter tumbae TaxID=163874 RepID=UPI00195894C9|nr:tRNA glutamyl-Q(34) synthetase GluQRS [Arthrobacter tumbae]MBM7781711.1 glutamyl-tRNA synthetase [Arthrobacter tumbae]